MKGDCVNLINDCLCGVIKIYAKHYFKITARESVPSG
jgi:hypothetical protein